MDADKLQSSVLIALKDSPNKFSKLVLNHPFRVRGSPRLRAVAAICRSCYLLEQRRILFVFIDRLTLFLVTNACSSSCFKGIHGSKLYTLPSIIVRQPWLRAASSKQQTRHRNVWPYSVLRAVEKTSSSGNCPASRSSLEKTICFRNALAPIAKEAQCIAWLD